MADQIEAPESRDEYQAGFTQAWEQLVALLDTLDTEAMVVPTDDHGWNVRDHLAHICAYLSVRVAMLQMLYPWDGLGISREQYESLDLDARNELVRDMTKDVSPEDVREMLEETRVVLLDVLEVISDDALATPIGELHPSYPNPSPEQPVLFHLWRGSVWHVNLHRDYIGAIVATPWAPPTWT